jgi:hypothetical protein
MDKMFQMAPEIIVLAIAAMSFVGAVIGLLSATVSSLILKIDLRCVWKDALFGAIAVPTSLVLVYIVPWPENTVRRPIAGGGEMETTMNTLQHPLAVAFALASILPILHNIYRSRRSRNRGVAAA